MSRKSAFRVNVSPRPLQLFAPARLLLSADAAVFGFPLGNAPIVLYPDAVTTRLRNPELSVAIAPMDGIRQATGARELIWDLIGDYDDSSYMDYIRFASARYWLFEHAKLPDNQLDPLKDVPEERLAFALGDLNEVDLKRFVFAPHALVLKRMVLEASREKEKAATVANQLDKQFPHHFTRY